MMKLIVDGMLHGTGIRDGIEGGYIELETLGLSPKLMNKIELWLQLYEDVHYNGYEDEDRIKILYNEGINIAHEVMKELSLKSIIYFSDAKLTEQIINNS